jgi:hypothetical protein
MRSRPHQRSIAVATAEAVVRLREFALAPRFYQLVAHYPPQIILRA